MTSEEFKQAVTNVEESLKKALEENNLNLNYNIQFPQYNIVPNKIQLALLVLEEEKGKIIKVYSEKKTNDVQSKEETNK